MHTAATAADSVTTPFETVLTARGTRAQLDGLATEMDRPDEFSSPGPTRVFSVTLSNGKLASVVFHERKDLIEILAHLSPGFEAGIADLLATLSIAPEAITWMHTGIELHAAK